MPSVIRSMTVVAIVAGIAPAAAGCGGRSGGTPSTGSATSPSGAATTAQVQPSAAALQSRFVEVVHAVSPSVVQIETSRDLGSGVVFDGEGHIVTNNHVVGSAKTFSVTLAAGDRHKATLIGAFPPDDLAVIRLESGSPPAATFADSSKLQVGQLVLAMGNPLGLRSSVTQGIVSSLGRTVSEGNGAVITSAVQTSAAINPGNSGGALIDLAGRVIGIPTLAATDPQLGGGEAAGIGFAIPSNTVRQIAPQLISSGHVTNSGRGFLGVETASRLTGSGVVVADVQRGGPADGAGLRRGDVIVSVAGKPVPTTDALSAVLATTKPGTRVTVTVVRPDGTRMTKRIKLGESPG